MSEKSDQDFAIHRLTQRFYGGFEDAFLVDYFNKSLYPFRLSLALATLLYAMFGLLDRMLIPQVEWKASVIRYLIVCPYLFIYLLFTWTPYFRKLMQPLNVLTILVGGSGIIALTVIAYPPGTYYYYAGLILLLMWAYTFTYTRFIFASIAGLTLFAGYELVAIGLGATPPAILISNSFFFLSANIIGMVACYLLEFYKRRDFWQRRLLELERSKSEALLDELHAELVMAGEIQKSLLSPSTLSWPGGEISCYMKPSIEIGGDFYSYHLFEDGHFALAMGDVSGKGIPAALLMAASLSLFGSTLAQKMTPSERLSFLDEELLPYTEPRHQNCAFCYIELYGQLLQIVNAGGIPPFIRKQAGGVEWPVVKGFPLGHGLGSQLGYPEVQTTLADGDLIVLISDGAVEAKDRDQNMLGFQWFRQAVANAPNTDSQAMLDYLIGQVKSDADEGEPQDDFTIAVMRVG